MWWAVDDGECNASPEVAQHVGVELDRLVVESARGKCTNEDATVIVIVLLGGGLVGDMKHPC